MDNQLVTIDVPELKAIEQSRAAQIAQAFTPMSQKLAEFESGFNEIISESSKGVTEELSKKAKRLRIDIGKIRIETGKIKDSQKETIKLEDKAIMGVHNWLVLAVTEKENRLSEIEKHFERIETERKEKLRQERIERLSEFAPDAGLYDVANMSEEAFNQLLEGMKLMKEKREEAERKAEAERLENERLDKVERDRMTTILPYRQFWTCENYALREMSDTNFETIVSDLKKLKSEYDAEQERIRLENERLKKEHEAAEKERIRKEKEIAEERRIAEEKRIDAEKKAKKEREEIEAKARKEKAAAEEKLRKERAEAQAKIEAERKKADEERRAAEKKAAEEREKARIEKERLEKLLADTIRCPHCKKEFLISDVKG